MSVSGSYGFLRLAEMFKKREQPGPSADGQKSDDPKDPQTPVQTDSKEAGQPLSQHKPHSNDATGAKSHEAQPQAQPEASHADPAEPRDNEARDEFTAAPEGRGDRPSAARIVAYSDSDSDDEPLMRRRKAREKGNSAGSDAEGDVLAGSGAGPDGSGRAGLAARSHQKLVQAKLQAKTGARRMKKGINIDLLLKVFLLAIFHRVRPRSTTVFEILSLAVPLPAALASWMKLDASFLKVPAAVRATIAQVRSFAGPTLTLEALRFALHRLPPDIQERFRPKRRGAGGRPGLGSQGEPDSHPHSNALLPPEPRYSPIPLSAMGRRRSVPEPDRAPGEDDECGPWTRPITARAPGEDDER
ncbi:hypothetical protein WJX84_004051 [Apatococcus fuscideae]|uniref:Uncharacterized protein n=1 Tax=Apatococcus fuscideae TaxID=2026836 RepID=A0AAW1S2Q7_9CHLO